MSADAKPYTSAEERDAALAACAEMRAALEMLVNSPEHGDDCDGEECGRCKGTGVLGDMTCDTCGGDAFVLTVQCVAHCAAKESARKALSSDAGRGWVSPEAFDAALREVAAGLCPDDGPGSGCGCDSAIAAAKAKHGRYGSFWKEGKHHMGKRFS